MSIQFRCPGCSQPIEVDDVHAGQTATCPYCRRVVNVPTASALDQSPSIAARPAAAADGSGPPETTERRDLVAPPSLPAQPIPGGLHVGAGVTHSDQVARTYGNYALICIAIATALMMATMVYGATVTADKLAAPPESRPSLDEVSQQLALEHPGLAAGPLGAMLFAVVGLALGIASVRQTTSGNWRGIVSVVICGLFILCFCGINGLGLLLGGAGPPA